jgi:hypothetical protein
MAKQTKQTETNTSVDEKQPYRVTDLAPGRINGKTARKGQELLLTESEARAELLAGHLQSMPAEKAV